MSDLTAALAAFSAALAGASAHKDGRRVAEDLLPLMAANLTTTDPVDKVMGKTDDASMLVRAFLQGADPLFIGLMVPDSIDILEEILLENAETDVEVMDGIRKAHAMGPAALLSGSGWDGDPKTYDPDLHGQEVAWLILASFSRTHEGGFGRDWGLTARLRDGFTQCALFEQWLGRTRDQDHDLDLDEALDYAAGCLDGYLRQVEFEDVDGIPTTTHDIGFYIGYKKGYSCVAVKAQGMTFYGTPPSTTLEAQGVTVDKAISPSFGIVFDKGGDQ